MPRKSKQTQKINRIWNSKESSKYKRIIEDFDPVIIFDEVMQAMRLYKETRMLNNIETNEKKILDVKKIILK